MAACMAILMVVHKCSLVCTNARDTPCAKHALNLSDMSQLIRYAIMIDHAAEQENYTSLEFLSFVTLL